MFEAFSVKALGVWLRDSSTGCLTHNCYRTREHLGNETVNEAEMPPC